MTPPELPTTGYKEKLRRGYGYRIKVRNRALKKAGYRCTYCGKDLLETLDGFFSVTTDHVMPREVGGNGGDANRVAACVTCNKLKSNAVYLDLETARRDLAQKRAKALCELAALRAAVRGVEC